MPKTNGYISLMDASKFCNYSQEYLSLRARQGKLKAVKFGRNWVTKKEWLEEYLNKNSRPLEVIKTKSKVQGFRYALRYSLVVVLIFFFLSFLVPATLIINKDIWRTVSGVFVTNQEQVLRTSSHIGNSIHQISFLTESQDILKADINIFQQFADWYHGQTVLLGQKIVALYDSVKSFFSPIETVIVEKEVINEETLREIEKLQLRIEEMEKQGLSQQEIIEEIQKITQTESLKEVIKEIQVVDYQSLAQLKDLLNRMTQAETDIEALIVLSQQPRSRSSYISSSQDLRNLNIVGSTVLGDETSDTLTVNATSIFNGPASFSEIDSDLIPSVTNTYNLGSATNYWNSAYINNITVGSTNMAGTTSESFVLNTDNTTADAEDMWLEFERGTATPNAKILWSNSLTGNSWFDLNFPIYLSGTGQISGPGATGLTLTNDIGDLTISTTTSGNLNLTSAGNITETIASAGTYTLTDATTNFLAVDTNGAIALTPTAGQDLSVNLSTTGDFVVNTNDFFIDTSENKIGIGTNAPSEKLHLQDGTLLIDQPVNPTLIGAYNTNDYAEGVYVSGKYAYVADSAGLYIIDVSNPSSPSLTSSYASGSGRGVYVSGKYAYVADGLAGLKIIDISNSSSPSLTGTYNTSGTARGVYVSGKYAYVADGLDGLQIIDISNPSSPSLTGTYNTSGGAIGVYVSGKYAYVVDGLAGLQIIDISNSSSPSLTGTYNTSDYAEGVYVSGKYAYVADAESGLQIIDISNPSSPSLTGTYNTSDYAYGVYVSGKYAYVADGFAGLQIIDISNPSSPSLTGTYNTSGTARGVYVSGKYAYVADDEAGLQIIDIKGADIHALAAGNISTNDLTVWENADIGNNLYVRSGLDVGPRGIYSQGSLDSYINLTGTTAGTEYGNRIILSDTGVVTTGTDITYGQKTEVTRTGATGGTINTYGQYVSVVGDDAGAGTSTATAGYFSATGADTNYGLIVENGYVGVGTTTPSYMLDVLGQGRFRGYIENQGFEDIAFPPTGWTTGGDANWLRTTGEFQEGTASAKSGDIGNSQQSWLDIDYTFTETGVISFYWKVSSEQNYDYLLFCVDNDSCTIASGYDQKISGTVDWTLVSKAVLAGTHSFRWKYIKDGSSDGGTDEGWLDNITFSKTSLIASSGLVVEAGYVGIGTTNPLEKLHLQDGTLLIDQPVNPTLIGTYNTSGTAYGVYVSGKYAYVADGLAGLQIIDISNPSSPSLTGTYNTSDYAYGVYVSGKYAYVADGLAGLQIIDISNPSSPSLTGTYNTSGTARGVYVSAKYAYVADGLAGLQIIDISNPSSPSLTGTYNTSDYAEGVYVSGKYAYVADAESGLQIIDISNPSSPSLTGTYNTSDYAYGVYVSGKYAYVADGFAGLQIIDISNPSSPSLTGTYNTSGYTEGVYVSGKYAYLADGYSGLKIIDVSNPSSPNLVGGHNLSDDYQWDVFVSGKYAYLADRNYGLHIVDIKGADIHALAAGNVSTNDLTVWENADIGNNLYVRSGLNVGPQGIYSQGPIAGSFSVSPSGNITMADDTWIGLASDGGRIVFDSTPAEDTITVNSAHLLFSADNTYDIGASGATRPRTGYFGTSVVVADTTTLTTDALIGSGALTVQSTGADLTLTNTTSGNIAITSLGNITETIASAGTYTLTDATTNFLAVNSSGAIAITPTAGQDLSVNLTTTGDFAVNTNDFFIDTSEGKIGIGTAVPSAGLEVASIEGIDLKIGDDLSGLPYNSTDTYFTIGQSDSSSNIYIGQDGSNYGAFSWFYNSTPANAYLKISTNNNQNIMMSPGTANVGIGVADPDTRLEVYYAGTQMKLSYDGTDNATFAVDDNGDLIINTSGGDISLGDENLTTTGTITGNFSVSPSGNIVMADDTWIGLASDGGRIVFDSTPDPDTLTINAADLLFNADNTYDIGASGASRPRTGYFGTSVVVGDTTALDANSLTGSGTLTVQSTGADLTLTNVTSGNIAITSLGNLTETIATGSTYTLKDGSTNFLAIDASGAMAMTPTSGQDLSVNLATTGDFVVNTNDFFIDTSEGKIGIGTTTPKYKFDVTGQGRFFSLSTTPLTLIQAETTGKLAEFKAHLPGAVNLSLGTSLNELTTTLIPKSALEFRFKSSVAWTAKSAWNTPDVGGKTRPAFADLDNDGDYDLLIGASSGLSYAYENTGSPTSPAWTEKSAWNTPDIGEGSDPAFADLDNDGDYDLLIGASSGLSYAYENTGSPTSPAWTEKSAWNAPDIGTYSGPAFADLDNDGDYDLLIGELNGISYAYENTGSASSPAWTAKSSWNAPDIGNYSTPAFADLDNDGDYDLLIGAITGISYAYENTGSASSPTWTAKSAWNAPKVGNSDSDPAFADLDNDGDYDLLIGEWNGISYAYENTGSNTSIFFGKLGNVGIGLAAPGRHLDVLDATAATPQLRLTSDADTYGEFYIDATGDLSIGLTDGSGGDDIIILDENLKICSGGSFGSVSCPSITLTGTGNLVVEGDVYAAGGYKNSFSFMYSDVADSQTDLVIDVLGLAGNTEYILPYSGSIIGVSATSNADLTAGTVTVDPAINGTKTGLTTTLSDTYQYNSATQDVNTDTFSAGDRLTIKVTTDADVEPNTIDIVVTIVIEY